MRLLKKGKIATVVERDPKAPFLIATKVQFLASSGRVDTAIWMHYMDANLMYGEK